MRDRVRNKRQHRLTVEVLEDRITPSLPSPQAVDPFVPGPLAVTTEEYGSFSNSIYLPGYNAPVEELASVHYPTGLPGGPYPLVVFLHGRHATTYDLNTKVTATIDPGLGTVTPVSMAGIVPGATLVVNGGDLREVVDVTATTATTFTANFAFAHTGTWSVTTYDVNTSVSQTIDPGIDTVAPVDMTGIVIGAGLTVDA